MLRIAAVPPLLALLSGCIAVDEAKRHVDNLQFRAPVLAPPPMGRAYTYLCSDGRVVTARYAGRHAAELRWNGRAATLGGLADPDRHVRSGMTRGEGYGADDLSWHRHGAEAQLRSGAVTTHCRLTNAAVPLAMPTPAMRRTVVADTYRGGTGKH